MMGGGSEGEYDEGRKTQVDRKDAEENMMEDTLGCVRGKGEKGTAFVWHTMVPQRRRKGDTKGKGKHSDKDCYLGGKNGHIAADCKRERQRWRQR